MKYKFLIIASFILLTTIIHAQEISIGIYNGISLYGINGRYDFKNFDNTQVPPRIGPNLGFLIDLRTTRFLILQLEVNYKENGFKFKNADGLCGVGYRGYFNLRYISFPMTANFEIGKNIQYFGFIGVSLDLLIKSENYISLSSTSSPERTIYDMSYDPSNTFNKCVFDGIIGLGIRIPFCEQVRFIIDTRYNFGISMAAKNTEFDYNATQWTVTTPDNFQKVHNWNLAFNIGIIYRFQKQEKNAVVLD